MNPSPVSNAAIQDIEESLSKTQDELQQATSVACTLDWAFKHVSLIASRSELPATKTAYEEAARSVSQALTDLQKALTNSQQDEKDLSEHLSLIDPSRRYPHMPGREVDTNQHDRTNMITNYNFRTEFFDTENAPQHSYIGNDYEYDHRDYSLQPGNASPLQFNAENCFSRPGFPEHLPLGETLGDFYHAEPTRSSSGGELSARPSSRTLSEAGSSDADWDERDQSVG